MGETRKLAAILVSDVVGYSRLAGSDEDRILARLRALRSDLIDPIIAVYHGRIVKRTGDGAIVEFRSVVDAVRSAIEVQNGMVERNAGVPPDRRIEFRIGIHLGDIVEESDGDLMGDGVNIAARLEGIAKPGAICLSEDAYRQVKSRLDLAVSDLGETQLKNIAEPVRVYSVEVGKPSPAKPTGPAPRKRGPLSLTGSIAAALAAIAIAAGGGWYFLIGQKSTGLATLPARLSIVVLPFSNLSADKSQDYLADGITENLTTELSRIRNSFVVARNTAFAFKGKNADAKDIGKELKVRYVLEGSVQRDDNRVRVNAQLIDTATNAHVWADRFENDLADLLKLQDEVVARLARTLQVELLNAEAQRSLHERSQNPDAVDLTLRGLALLNQPIDKTRYLQAGDLFEQAIQLDPSNADAFAGAAVVGARANAYGWFGPGVEVYGRAMQRADQAIVLNPNQPYAHYAKALLLMYKLKPNDTAAANETFAEAEASLRADPSFVLAYLPMAVAKNCLDIMSKDYRTSNKPLGLVRATQILAYGANKWEGSY
jgi:adenylate cyclase